MEVRDRRGGFFWLNNEIVDDYAVKIGSTALLVYAVLSRYANNTSGESKPSQETIARICEISIRSVKRAIARLEENRLLQREQRTAANGKWDQNVYVLLRPEVLPGATSVPREAVTGGQTGGQTGGHHSTMNKKEQERTRLKASQVPLEPVAQEQFVLDGSPSLGSSKKKETDPRHQPFKEMLVKFWNAYNKPHELYWDASEAGQLGTFLKKWPKLTAREFYDALLNYRDSSDVVISRTPKQFLSRLNDYFSGSLNKFHQPIDEEDSHAQA